jgi:hypothetical protein
VNTGGRFSVEIAIAKIGILNYVVLSTLALVSMVMQRHNGLLLNGVGSGTTLSNIWIANGDDDGIGILRWICKRF